MGFQAADIQKALGPLAQRIEVEVLPSCASTNLILKELAEKLRPWHTVIARCQTDGRGRLDRQFFSPDGTGLYLSVLLRPLLSPEETTLITPAAAVAVCRALEEAGSERAEIKWVNDVYIRGRKVCGILTEAGPGLTNVIVGVGINLMAPVGGFPDEIAQRAGAVFPRSVGDVRAQTAAAFLRHFYALCAKLSDRGFVDDYRSRSFLVGQRVDVIQLDRVRPALVLGVDAWCRLVVRYDGEEEAVTLSSGEVSIRQV